MQHHTRFAAVDMGSNSFRLEIGEYKNNRIVRETYYKETVRLGSGLDANGYLSADAMQAGWDCLKQFGNYLHGFTATQVRAVTTQTLREAKNATIFLAKAQALLGFPIQIISGDEEARLIYLGVAHMLPVSNERRLVIDIGGRSTEIILGQQLQSTVLGSFALGSMSWSMNYFADGKLSKSAFDKAKQDAIKLLTPAMSNYPPGAWEVAYGASGSVHAVAEILAAAGFPNGCITREGLAWLTKKLIKSEHASKVRLVGLKKDRRPIIGGGVSVLLALFEALKIEQLNTAQGSLRHGVMYTLIE